jgi:uncharacterized protein (DUF362 family)
MTKVSVVEAGKGVDDAVRRSVDLLGRLRLEGDEHVVIKPNVCNAKNPYGMVITDFRVIEAVIDLVREKTDRITVVESDNISGTADERMEGSGLLGKLGELGVEYINLSNDEFEVHEVAGVNLQLPRTVLDADYFINLPKMKTCGHTLVTLSIKNLFGVLRRAKKSKLHSRLDGILPYLARVIRHDLIVVDGITAMEGNGPVIGTPKALGVIIAGVSPVSVDAICARMMGFDPYEIKHMLGAHEMGLGEMDIDAIDVVGDDWRRFASEFERPYSLKATLKSIKSIRKVYL